MLVLEGLFKGWADHRRTNPHEKEYGYFKHTDFLHSSEHINHMYNRAATNEQKGILLEYMQNYEVDSPEYAGYHSVATKIKMDLGLIQQDPFTPIQKKWLMDQFQKGGM